jgi:hypothetical protein
MGSHSQELSGFSQVGTDPRASHCLPTKSCGMAVGGPGSRPGGGNPWKRLGVSQILPMWFLDDRNLEQSPPTPDSGVIG